MSKDVCTLLTGTYDSRSPLNKLQGQRDALELIACDTDKLYDEHIQVNDKSFTTLFPRYNHT